MLGGFRSPLGGTGSAALGVRKGGYRLAGLPIIANSGADSFTADKRCIVLVYAWGGGGGGGGHNSGNGGSGGGGGAALFKAVPLSPGQTISYSVGLNGSGATTTGTAGGDTTVTLPSGFELRARGGAPGVEGSATGGAGGRASGGETNRDGGAGGGRPTLPGFAGQDGGAGGVPVSIEGGGGGGAGGFKSQSTGIKGGDGSSSAVVGATPGGGGSGGYSGSTSGQNGGTGRVILIPVRP